VQKLGKKWRAKPPATEVRPANASCSSPQDAYFAFVFETDASLWHVLSSIFASRDPRHDGMSSDAWHARDEGDQGCDA
jgi:hypothetical protein